MNTIDVIAELKCLGESNRRYDAIFSERILNKLFNDLRCYCSNRVSVEGTIIYTGVVFRYEKKLV